MIKGNSAVIDGGIKSLDPPCLGKASLVGNHPYTCETENRSYKPFEKKGKLKVTN